LNAPVVLLGLIGLTAVFVMLPVGLAVYSACRQPRRLRCPVTERDAAVRVDAYGAAVAAALGADSVRVSACSLWPENSGCGQECLLGRSRHG
jgi:hypothetical protein